MTQPTGVHVPRLNVKRPEKKPPLTKASGAEPIYVYRPLLNAEELVEWARSQGFTSALNPDDMHATVVYSRRPFSADLSRVASYGGEVASNNVVVEGGTRAVTRLGDKGAVVLNFESAELSGEHRFYESQGASWDFPEYLPHVSITYRGIDRDISEIEPFTSVLVFGPLKAAPILEEWSGDADEVSLTTASESPDLVSSKEGLLDKSLAVIMGSVMEHAVAKSATILKADEETRMVYGWASVATVKGELVVDQQGDTLEPSEMVKMADGFMASVRTAKAMHQGAGIGEVLHSMPLTNDIMKAFGISCDREGWLIAMKIHDDATWARVKSGDLAELSIGGRAGVREAIE